MPPAKKGSGDRKAPAGKAEPPENKPAATNGQEDKDELERRRKARDSKSVSERVDATGGEDGDGQTEAFPAGVLEGDPKVTHKTYIPPGASTSTEVSMSRAAVPNPGGGLFRAGEEQQVLVRVLPGSVKETPINIKQGDGTYKVKEWKVAQELAVIFVQHAGDMYSREQVLELFHQAGVASAVVSRVLGDGPQAAQA